MKSTETAVTAVFGAFSCIMARWTWNGIRFMWCLMGHKGIVYKRNGDDPQLYYIPGGMSFIELLPMELVDKNTIYNHMSVEEIYFPEGTKRLESYAIENCPKLKRIYVPVNATIANNALYNVPKNVDIIRGVPSGITNITMD